MVQTLSINFERPLPVFPLSTCVLLPHVALPLHIFESRYRQMTREAIDSHGLIAMAMFNQDVDEAEYTVGRPPLRPYVCLGYIAQYQKLEDERFLLLLQGVCRARLAEVIEHEPYRLARLTPVDIEPPDEQHMAGYRARLETAVLDPRFDDVDSINDLRQVLGQDAPMFALIDLATMTFCRSNPEHLYRQLAEPDPFARADWICRRIENHKD